MATVSDYLTQLQTDKQTLVDNLVTKGVSATSDETFTSLVPKVLDIQSGSSDDLVIDNAKYLFYQGARLNSLNQLLNACKNVTNCSYMFHSCTNLDSINLKSLDTSNVTTMAYMFYNCSILTNIDLSNFNTSKTTSMSNMFNTCRSLESIDLSVFDASKVTNMSSMFYNCNNLKKVIINNPVVFNLRTTVFLSTPINDGTGFIYVPDDLVETYKSATNWSTYADQIKGMSELPTGDE